MESDTYWLSGSPLTQVYRLIQFKRVRYSSASEMTDIVSGGALNSTNSLTLIRAQLIGALSCKWKRTGCQVIRNYGIFSLVQDSETTHSNTCWFSSVP